MYLRDTTKEILIRLKGSGRFCCLEWVINEKFRRLWERESMGKVFFQGVVKGETTSELKDMEEWMPTP